MAILIAPLEEWLVLQALFIQHQKLASADNPGKCNGCQSNLGLERLTVCLTLLPHPQIRLIDRLTHRLANCPVLGIHRLGPKGLRVNRPP